MKYFILISTIVLIAIFGKPMGKDSSEGSADPSACENNSDCHNGKCVPKEEVVDGKIQTKTKCECDNKYTNDQDGTPCVVEKRNKLVAFLLSIFLGGFGADWFYLSKGAAGYIVAGIGKLITLGGLGIWWLVDWIRILCDSFPDSDGIYPDWYWGV